MDIAHHFLSVALRELNWTQGLPYLPADGRCLRVAIFAKPKVSYMGRYAQKRPQNDRLLKKEGVGVYSAIRS